MSLFVRCLVIFLWLNFVIPADAYAVDREGVARPDLEYRRLSKPSDTIGALGNDLFGEQVDHYSGQTGFIATDISLPGNSGLQVALTRSKQIQEPDGYQPALAMGDWDIEVPMLEGVFSSTKGWVGTGTNPNARCSQGNGRPPDYTTPEGGFFQAEEYWQGYQLKVPGQSSQQMLLSTAQTQNRSTPARWTTKNRWLIECLPTLKNGGAGEGFVAIAPDGTKYYFDRMVTKSSQPLKTRIKRFLYSIDTFLPGGTCSSSYPTITCTYYTPVNYGYMNEMDGGGSGNSCPQTNGAGGILVGGPVYGFAGGSTACTEGYEGQSNVYETLFRVSIHLLATRVEDKFGNWVDYEYNSSDKLTAIRSNDGRVVQIAYGSTHAFPVSASANGRVWNYSYNSSNNLTQVTQADGRSWLYQQVGEMWTGSIQSLLDPEIPYNPCWDNAIFNTNTVDPTINFKYIVTHPSGAKGEFSFNPRLQGKANAMSCEYLAISELSLTEKKISGPGINTAIWSFAYGPDNSSTKTKLTNPNGSTAGLPNDCTTMACIATVDTLITNPDGVVQKLTFGTRIDTNDGQLLESSLSKSGVWLKKERNQYVLKTDQAGFSTKVGDNPKNQHESIQSEYVLPQKRRLIEQDGTMFSWQAYAFDPFGRATDITRSSSLGYSKTELLTYHDNRNNWTIGQIASLADVASGKIEVFRTFDPTTARITSQQEFGQLAGTYTWNNDGSLATVKDANNNVTSFSNYYRGIPQRVTYADSNYESGVVNDNGWVTAMTDVLGSTTTFAYDSMGRLNAITPPAGDTVAWAGSTLTFEILATSVYGLPVGSWKQTISKGNYRKETFLDAQWRPVLTREFDNANIAGTQRFSRQSYDSEGRVVFASYPASTDVISTGIRTAYDGLGRVTKVEQDSELGILATTTQYLPGSKVVVTDPKGNQTTTIYQVLDSPETSMPVQIKSPEGITTTIVRDVFGKPLSTSRSGLKP